MQLHILFLWQKNRADCNYLLCRLVCNVYISLCLFALHYFVDFVYKVQVSQLFLFHLTVYQLNKEVHLRWSYIDTPFRLWEKDWPFQAKGCYYITIIYNKKQANIKGSLIYFIKYQIKCSNILFKKMQFVLAS